MSTAERFRRVREDHSRETAEDYVELIQALTVENGEARAVDLATRLGVSQVTVTKTIQRLVRDGLVTSQPYRAVFLTEEGRRLADESRRRHEIVVGFLLALGVGEQTAET
ncbi:MAG: manganese-binding transcriptional regulator MntR, partial [Armatimonadetes bacterium]|nr:manganese-binding transcriptional regulator MntR [Armatimonadota bacterium]